MREGAAEIRLPGASVQEIPLGRVIETVQELGVRGMDPEALPDNIKWKVECGPVTVFILEMKPDLRSIRWISPKSPAPLGPMALYETYRLATPFVVVKAPFFKRKIQPRCEIFYRNEPLRKLEDVLYWPNLLNVSPNAFQCTAWLCTQYLAAELLGPGRPGRRAGTTHEMDALLKHLWGGGFNGSSEVHEGASCFSKARAEGIDPRVTDVDRWQEESLRDPSFVLKVAWNPTDLTVGSLLRRELESWNVLRDLADASELISVLLGEGKEGPPCP